MSTVQQHDVDEAELQMLRSSSKEIGSLLELQPRGRHPLQAHAQTLIVSTMETLKTPVNIVMLG